MVVLPVKGGVDIILVQEYLAPRVTYADIPNMQLVTLLYHIVIDTLHINWIEFVHVVIESPRFMIVMHVSEGVYEYVSFLVQQDKIYRDEENTVDKMPNLLEEDHNEVADAPADNIF